MNNILNVSSQIIEGLSLNSGIGFGFAMFYNSELSLGNYQKIDEPECNLDFENEINSLNLSLEATKNSIIKVFQKKQNNLDQESKDILENYILLIEDSYWKNKILNKIKEGNSATNAIKLTLKEIKDKFKEDFFWQSRIHDLVDISQRLIASIKKQEKSTSHKQKSNRPVVLIAKFLSPFELLEITQEHNIVGMVVPDTVNTSHCTILAQSLKMPVVGGVKNLDTFVKNGEKILIDGESGRIHIHPALHTIESYQYKQDSNLKGSIDYKLNQIKNLPQTLDGQSISIYLNTNSNSEVSFINHESISGIGLYRTEMVFLVEKTLPNLQNQINLYKNVINASMNKPVIFRTFDIGGDKILPNLLPSRYNEKLREKGWRAIRLTLDLPSIMSRQLRALIRAKVKSNNPETPLKILVPMLADVSEFIQFRKLLEKEIEQEKKFNHEVPQNIQVGAMIEVPSLLYQIKEIEKLVDFISVGTNDLFQFLFAIDRNNTSVFDRYDILSVSFIRFLKDIVKKLSIDKIIVCGEMASDPLGAIALIGVGFKKLSINPPAIGKVHKAISLLNLQEFSKDFNEILENPFDSSSIRKWLSTYSQQTLIKVI